MEYNDIVLNVIKNWLECNQDAWNKIDWNIINLIGIWYNWLGI